jgi:branched-chain amino acid transport system permease protein
MEQFFQQLTNGLAVGGIYALIALGYTMVYGVMKLINFAHGDLFTIGSYLGLTLLTSLMLTDRLGPFLGVLVLAIMVMLLVGIVGIVLERAAYRPLRESPRLSAVVSALGASIFFQNTIMLIYGAKFHFYPQDILPKLTISLAGFPIPLMRIILLLTSVVMMVALYLFIQKTKIGTAIRAAAIDQGAARLMGIDVNGVIMIVFPDRTGPGRRCRCDGRPLLWSGQLHHGMALRTESLYRRNSGRYRQYTRRNGGAAFFWVSIEAMGAAYISIAWKDAIAFCVLILILIVRPTGLLGERVAEKI